VPFLPVIYLCGAYSISEFTGAGSLKKNTAIILSFLVLVIAVNEFTNLYYIENKSIHLSLITRDDPIEDTVKDNYLLFNAWTNISCFMRDNFDPNKVVLMARFCSLAPYISGLYAYDGYLLSDERSSVRLLTGPRCGCKEVRDVTITAIGKTPDGKEIVAPLIVKTCPPVNKLAVGIDHTLVDSIGEEYLKETLAQRFGNIIYYAVGKDASGRPSLFKTWRAPGRKNYIVWVVYVNTNDIRKKFCMKPVPRPGAGIR